ncbi:MAG TPA: MFS transporter [Candidatus Cryosericum sp.]|nr:MFS transporter [Candidatus Cryosericum sp.]
MSHARKALTAIAGGHFLVEWYAAFLPLLVPVFRARLGFSLAAAAALGASLPIVSGLVQTVFGLVSDHIPRANVLVVGSSLLAAISIAVLPFASTFPLLLLVFATVALALAMFHPQAAAATSRLSDNNRGRFMSVFNFGGSIGSFVGSLTVIPLLHLLQLDRFWILAIPGVALAVFQRSALARRQAEPDEPQETNGTRLSATPAFRGYLVLVVSATLNAIVHNGVTILLPLLFQDRGLDPGKAGVYLAVGSLAGAFSNVVGAELSDRVGRRTVNIVGAAGMALSLALFVLSGSSAFLWYVALCLFSTCTLSSNIVFGHELVTGHRGFVSASIMGFSWGFGGVVVAILGRWAQSTSIVSAYHLLLGVAAVLVVTSLMLPTRRAIQATLSPSPADQTA